MLLAGSTNTELWWTEKPSFAKSTVQLPGVSPATSSVPPEVGPIAVPFKLTWHSAGAQVTLSMPLATGLGGAGGAAGTGFGLLLITSIMSSEAPAASSLERVSDESENATPRFSIASR